jgi:hypothetical protein
MKGTEEANSHFSDTVFSGCTKTSLIRGIKSRPEVNQSLVRFRDKLNEEIVNSLIFLTTSKPVYLGRLKSSSTRLAGPFLMASMALSPHSVSATTLK